MAAWLSMEQADVADTISKVRRSWNMSRIRNRDTEPERIVRSLLRKLGYSSSGANPKGLPVVPDIVLARPKIIIQVHGCYWHRHSLKDRRCPITYTPKSGRKGREFWLQKFRENVLRDQRTARKLRGLGWHVITVWECQLRRPDAVAARLARVLRARGDHRRTEQHRGSVLPEPAKRGKV